jgi:hypothetical protein
MTVTNIALPEHDAKRFATLRATAALAGFELHTDPQCGFYATRWGQLRMFDSLDEVEGWLEMERRGA